MVVMASNQSKKKKIGTDADYISDSDSSGGDDTPCLCTFAVTGTHTAYQPILVCLDCSSRDDGICICMACAEQCHSGHTIDYIAMGHSYCDCQQLESNTCLLKESSEKEATRLAVSNNNTTHVAPPLQTDGEYVQDAFSISSLDDKSCDRLVKEASELVTHSRDTHWLELNADQSNEKYSKLEELACTILDRHVKEYQLCDKDTGEFYGGAEWWVQVKPITLPNKEQSPLDDAIDLHFDKDEALAESFDLGSFPTLSTVTYLTATSNASPTVVFPHTFDRDDGEVMDDMVVSYPRRGKHFVFDGRLLHGAPAHSALRSIQSDNVDVGENDKSLNRVTFLVNIWVNQQPSGVKPLSSEIRQLIRAAGKKKKVPNILQQPKIETVEFARRQIKEIRLEHEDDLPESIRGRITLPFVSKGATWINQVRGSGLIVVTFPPPPSNSDTIRVKFGPGLQAYLEYQDEDDADRFKVGGEQVDFV